MGVLFTNTNHITLKYVTDNWGTDINGFKLVITAIKDPSMFKLNLINSLKLIEIFLPEHACRDFRCHVKEFCIHPDLLCDGINHCSDGSDESTGANCQSEMN